MNNDSYINDLKEEKKSIARERKRKWIIENPEKHKSQVSKYKIKNKEKLAIKAKMYAIKNREKIQEQRKKYKIKNKEKILLKRSCSIKKEINKNKCKEWYDLNKEKNREKNSIRAKAYRNNNKNLTDRAVKSSTLKKKYGISLNEFEAMVLEQNGVCFICREPNLRRGKVIALCVDHNHKNGMIRKLLCCSCNTALAFFHDNVDFLENALIYIKREINND